MLYKIYINSNNMCFEINEIIDLLKIEDECLSNAFNDIGSKYKILFSKKYIDLKFQYIHESTLMTRDIVYFKAVSEVLKEIMFHFKTLALTHKLQIILDFKDIRHESFSKFKKLIIILTSSCELFDSKSENSIQHHFEKLCNVDAFLYKELNRYTSLLLKFTFKYKKIKTVLKIMKSLN